MNRQSAEGAKTQSKGFMPLIAELYAQLPGVKATEAEVFEPHGSTLCVTRNGDRYEYVVDAVSGDPLEGDLQREAHLFASDAAGGITALGVWSSESGEPTPEWFGRVCR